MDGYTDTNIDTYAERWIEKEREREIAYLFYTKHRYKDIIPVVFKALLDNQREHWNENISEQVGP